MKTFLIIVLIMFAITVTACSTNNSAQYTGTPKPESETTKRPIIQQEKGYGNSYKTLNTNLDDTYYKSAIGKSGGELKEALHEIISAQTVLGYNDDLWEALSDSDEDPNNSDNVLLFYAGRSDSKSDHGSNKGQWNREHVWAQSHGKFGRSRGIGSDLHNLKPEDEEVNFDRGRLDFDITETEKSGENKYLKAPDTYKDKDSWEPRDKIKGDISRIILYMDTRYEDEDQMNLKAVDRTVQGNDPHHGKLSTLLKWHEEDPVDAFEKRRNEVIYEKYQHNRNPFIDHPEWVSNIWGKVE